MLLSNKLTYCITTFIFLLSFATLPVIAHNPEDQTFEEAHDGVSSDSDVPIASEIDHTHTAQPTVVSITAEDSKGAVGTAGGALVSNVDGKKIVLVNDADGADAQRLVIALAGGDATATPPIPNTLAAGEFVLKITFDLDVYSEAQEAATTVPTFNADDITVDDITLIVAAVNNPTLDIGTGSEDSNFTVASVTRVDNTPADATEEVLSKREFLVTVEVTAGITEAQTPLSIWVNVKPNTVFTRTALNGNETVFGRGNAGYEGTDPFSLDGYVAPSIETDTAGPNIVSFADGDVDADGNIPFTLTFNEALGATGLIAKDLTITGGTLVEDGIAPQGSATSYTIKVKPNADPTEAEVTVKLNDGSVSDKVDGARYVEPMENVMMGRYDTVNPTVNAVATGVIGTGTGTTGNGIAVGMVKLSVTFSEELGSDVGVFMNDDIDRTNSNVLLTNTQPELAAMPENNKTVYELTVTPVPANAAQVVLVIKAGSVMDMVGNPLEQDTIVTWTRPGAPGTETGKPVVALQDPLGADSGSIGESPADDVVIDDAGGSITFTISDDVALAADTAVEMSEVSVSNGTVVSVTANSITVNPKIADDGKVNTTVTVTVAAGAIADAAGNMSDEVSATYSIGPIFAIPKDTILVVTKSAGATHTYLSDQPRLPVNQNPPTPTSAIETAIWSNMPDLEVLFSLAGGNGGTLNLIEANRQDELPQTRDGDKQQKNSVRISEIMWASDLRHRGGTNDAEAAEQWIEISNDTGAAVRLLVYARTGLDSAISIDDNAEDRVGNAYNGSRGSAGWNVPGQNGNSWTGENFVSMHRSYVTGDNRGYVNGTASGHWHASDREYLTTVSGNGEKLYDHVGSPGLRHGIQLAKPATKAGVTQVPSSPVVINEVANRGSGNEQYEWIELRNVTDNEVNLRNWMISVVRATDDDKPLVQFPNNDNAKIAPQGVILLLASDPRTDDEHPIAVGYNVDVNVNDQVDGLGLNVPGSNRMPPRQKVINFENGGLPDGGDYILILRKHDNYEGHRSGADGGKGVAETGGADIDKIIDIAGSHRTLDKANYPETNPAGLNSTTLWPLVNFNGDMRPHYGDGDVNKRRHNRLDVNRVRYRQHVVTKAKNNGDGATPGNRAGTGTTHKDEGHGHYAFRDAIYTGLGYKRTARVTGYNNGTPGYNGNSVGNTGVVKATTADAMVTISEIMYSTGPNADNPVYPQWIELYNSSPVNAVNLNNWKLRFEMLDADGNPMDSLMDLNFNSSRSVKTIQPQQTVLIVAGNARQANSDSATGGDVFNENRVFNVYRDVGGGKFGDNTRYMFFNPTRFNIALVDKDNKVVDAAGNLDGDDRTSDSGNWDVPAGIAMDGNRTSIIRVYDNGEARDGVNLSESNIMPVFGTGDKMMKGNDGIDEKYSWIPAANTEREFKITIKSTWFGDEDDYGTPNNRPGMVLPVELSHFRPTLEDGKVTIRWTTESELDNAGFNILRSETRSGEYTQVNAELIEGAGTTGERNTYKWVDQTAKPGVVYYYQIEDVSFAGEHQALAVSKLKGLVSAENKLTTTWSELKASQ